MVIVKNGEYIYNSRTAIDFLYSLGMDNIDINTFRQYISEDGEEHTLDYWKQEAKEWEKDSIHNYELRNGLICEIQNLADELASGKGGTKAQYADRLRNLCEYWA